MNHPIRIERNRCAAKPLINLGYNSSLSEEAPQVVKGGTSVGRSRPLHRRRLSRPLSPLMKLRAEKASEQKLRAQKGLENAFEMGRTSSKGSRYGYGSEADLEVEERIFEGALRDLGDETPDFCQSGYSSLGEASPELGINSDRGRRLSEGAEGASFLEAQPLESEEQLRTIQETLSSCLEALAPYLEQVEVEDEAKKLLDAFMKKFPVRCREDSEVPELGEIRGLMRSKTEPVVESLDSSEAPSGGGRACQSYEPPSNRGGERLSLGGNARELKGQVGLAPGIQLNLEGLDVAMKYVREERVEFSTTPGDSSRGAQLTTSPRDPAAPEEGGLEEELDSVGLFRWMHCSEKVRLFFQSFKEWLGKLWRLSQEAAHCCTPIVLGLLA